MINNGWIKKGEDEIDQVKILLQYFGVANLVAWEKIWVPKIGLLNSFSFRKSDKFEIDKMSLAAWIRQGQIDAEKIICKDFDKKKLIQFIPKIMALTEEKPSIFIPKLKEIGKECGVAFVFVKELPGLPVYGVTYWTDSSKVIVEMTLRQKTNDQFWFSLFHEIGHIIKHGKKDFYIQDDEEQNSLWEEEANKFARETLINDEEYTQLINDKPYTAQKIVCFSKSIGIAPGIVVGRLQHDKLIEYNKMNKLKIKYEWL